MYVEDEFSNENELIILYLKAKLQNGFANFEQSRKDTKRFLKNSRGLSPKRPVNFARGLLSP